MSDVVYRSEVRIERFAGSVRKARLPGEQKEAVFGVHGAIAEHYGRGQGSYEPHATTIDYVIAATGGWLLGTFGGALEARQIPATDGKLVAKITGEVELDGKVLVIRRIHARLELQCEEEQRAPAQRVLGFYADHCPLYRTLKGAIQITSELAFV